jgi:carboxyl-terminal processing protease
MAGRERAGYLKPTIQKFYRAAGSSTQLKGVESDIVLPSIYGGLEVGEKYMDHRLDHDVIEPAAGFKAANRSKLFIADLKASSIKRVNASIDFQYMLSDVERMEKRIEANSISLDKITRLKDITTIDVQTKKRNKERIVRFNKLQQDDVKTMNVYRLELDDLSKKKMFKLDLTDIKDTHMRVAKSDLADLNQTPNWPSQMNAAMREELNILWDLATLSKGKGLAKATTK